MKKERTEVRFGRCEDWEREACCSCTPEGKTLCEGLRTISFRSPRKGPKSVDSRHYCAIVNDVLRLGCLGPSLEGVVLTYLHLISWTSAHSDLVYRRTAKQLAFVRGISKDAFLRHIKSLEALQLVRRVPRASIVPYAGLQEHAYFLMPIPKTIRILVRLHEDVAQARSFAEQESAMAVALGARHELLERYQARLHGGLDTPDEDEVFEDYGTDPDPGPCEEDEDDGDEEDDDLEHEEDVDDGDEEVS